MLWILVLFGATALLRESIGEISVHLISRLIFKSSYVHTSIIDSFSSCSNNGRSLGFGSLWRLHSKDPILPFYITCLPFLCWAVGMPIKLIAVQAPRGGFSGLGQSGTWTLGAFWILFAICTKISAILLDVRFGLNTHNLPFLSYRKLYQYYFCTVNSRINWKIKDLELNKPLSFELLWDDTSLHISLVNGS